MACGVCRQVTDVREQQVNAEANQCAAQQSQVPGLAKPPHVHTWRVYGTAPDELHCECGAIVGGRLEQQPPKPPENCVRCVDCEAENMSIRSELTVMTGARDSWKKRAESMGESMLKWESQLGEVRGELARTKEALAEAVMGKRGKR